MVLILVYILFLKTISRRKHSGGHESLLAKLIYFNATNIYKVPRRCFAARWGQGSGCKVNYTQDMVSTLWVSVPRIPRLSDTHYSFSKYSLNSFDGSHAIADSGVIEVSKTTMLPSAS